MKNYSLAFLAASALVICACGSVSNTTGENYGDIAQGPGGITLVQSEHPVGWGKSNCFECHSDANIHQAGRSGTGLNLAAIRTLTEEQGLDSCATCHGTNGVE